MSTAHEHYVVEELADGVHAALHKPGGAAICNSGIVDLGGGGLVFDTGLTRRSARELVAVATERLGRAPSVAANSHWHLDHSLGNSEFASRPIWGTRRTREILLEMHDTLSRELRRDALERDLKALESRRAGMRAGPPLDDLEFTILIQRSLLEDANRTDFPPPTETFESRVDLPGSRRAQLVTFGSGHTEADALLYLPREKVVFAGDLVCLGIEPSMGSGDPEHWLTVLDQVEAIGAERVVPGHGPVSPIASLQETREYVSGVMEAARNPKGTPLPAAIRKWEGSVSLESNLEFARSRVARPAGGN